MNLKLVKRIRQGLREMAQVETGGAISGQWPDDYEGEIPRKRGVMKDGERQLGELWATEQTNEAGEKSLSPMHICVRLRLMTARQIYKRAKRMVA